MVQGIPEETQSETIRT